MGISAYRLAKETGLSLTRVSEIVRMKKRNGGDCAASLQVLWQFGGVLARPSE